jgi:hypothetical protein
MQLTLISLNNSVIYCQVVFGTLTSEKKFPFYMCGKLQKPLFVWCGQYARGVPNPGCPFPPYPLHKSMTLME